MAADRTPADPSDDWTVPDLLAAIESAMSDGEYDTSYLLVPAAALLQRQAHELRDEQMERSDAERQLDTLRKRYEWCAGLLGTHDHTGSDHMEDAAREAERAEAQLDTFRKVGDPDSIRLMADNLTGIGWTPEAEVMHAVADAVDALAAAGGGVPEEGATDERIYDHGEDYR